MSSSAAKSTSNVLDRQHMEAALALARRGLGRAWPNPTVGCVLAKGEQVVGRGWTQPGGRPHAETEALARAGSAAQDATAYVTLEPCAHRAKTPPCCEALIEAGIGRCVVALEDPDPRVSGRGLEALRAAEIEVELGVGAEQAREVNAGYLLRHAEGRPLVTLKLATTLDGRIATRTGESRWVTGPEARARAHLLRAEHDAVLVGSGTAVADDPRLDVRLPGLEAYSPVRVVLDGRLRLPLTHDLVVRAAEQPSLLFTRHGNDGARLEGYRQAGVDIIEVGDSEMGELSLEDTLQELGNRGITRVLVEGGGHVAADLLRRNFVDRLVWFRAAKVFGGDGVPAAVGFGLERIDEAPRFQREALVPLGAGVMECYRRAAEGS